MCVMNLNVFRLRMADFRDFFPAAAGRACAKSLSSSPESWAWIPDKSSSRAALWRTKSGLVLASFLA